ncbi:MAG: Asp-tRNA(Asn)/Glu-tRNA(Gln) amidotransferase subunit GatC [Sedimentisphaerales bacterium]|nr:Asp-tRNA(Asn)/Glu-tRNA(Gln) amidotransferase subunit GatC [Sedimentisphaerales bacterium]
MAQAKIDEKQVRQVAKLARLQLNDQQISEFTTQLGAILGYIEKLNKLDTGSVEPLAHCLPVHNVFRDDVVRPSLGTEKVIANAPQTDGQFFLVPKILEDGAGE